MSVHNINLFSKWTFNNKKPPSAAKIAKRAKKGNSYKPKVLFNLSRDCPQIKSTIQGVKELVTYFKHSSLNSQITARSLFFPLNSYM